jgi:hypothetical protein
MPSLIDLRRRIRSVKNTQQVTKAMKMVSAAKLRRAQDRVIAARPYTQMFRQVLGDVASVAAGDAASHPLLAFCWFWSLPIAVSPGRSTRTSSKPRTSSSRNGRPVRSRCL